MRSALEALPEASIEVGNRRTYDSEVEYLGSLMANHCISNKLKTPLGKAQETLGAFERALRTLATNFEKQLAPWKKTPEKIRQARNFLVIFDGLEKAMYQAWDGNNLSAFFVANRKTCLDWLSRHSF